MIYRIDSKAFAKALVRKADEKDVVAENITAYTFRFNKQRVVVRLLEDDESFILYMQLESHYLRLLEQYLGYRHDSQANWIGYTLRCKGTSVDEVMAEMELIHR